MAANRTSIGRWVIAVLALAALSGCGPRLGLWVECEGSNDTLKEPADIDAMIERAASHRVTDLYVQVYRRNRSWFRSELCDDAPYRELAGTMGADPIDHMIARAHARGMRFHAWLNVFNIGKGTDQEIVRRLGRDVVIVDDRGVSMADYAGSAVHYPEGDFSLDAPPNWVDPADLGVQAYLLDLVERLLRDHPGLDGVHLDFIRYPYALPMTPVSRMPLGLGFGFNPAGMARFRAETGLEPPCFGADRSGANAWDQWRRDQVTDFVRKVRGLTAPRRMRLSAAVLAWADRAYLTAFQDWRTWLEEGCIDEVVVMNYTKDTRFARHVSRQSVAARGKGKVLIGLGAYVMASDPGMLERQAREALEAGADGIVLFSYDEMVRNPALFDAVKKRRQ